MSTPKPVLVHPQESSAGAHTPGLEMRHYFDADKRWIGWSGWITNDAGEVSGWHHHAANDTFVYLIRGRLTIEFGPSGTQPLEAAAGDFIVIPAQTVHRETTSREGDVEAFVMRVGGEPEHVKVNAPH
jgi:mannose-6-phosphate isomerase-like protein (cupin superfamily)